MVVFLFHRYEFLNIVVTFYKKEGKNKSIFTSINCMYFYHLNARDSLQHKWIPVQLCALEKCVVFQYLRFLWVDKQGEETSTDHPWSACEICLMQKSAGILLLELLETFWNRFHIFHQISGFAKIYLPLCIFLSSIYVKNKTTKRRK